MICLTNRYFWLHFLIVLFNLGDLVKDITFTAAVQHFDTNIVQAYETETSTGDKVKNLILLNYKISFILYNIFSFIDLKIQGVLGVQCELCVHHKCFIDIVQPAYDLPLLDNDYKKAKFPNDL